jgi:hypothetical protein
MAQSGTPASEYVRLVGERTAEILDAGRPASYPLSLAAVTSWPWTGWKPRIRPAGRQCGSARSAGGP